MDSPPADDPLDRAQIAELLACLSRAALLEVIDTFEADIPRRTSEITGAVVAREAGALHDAAHTLKGASANLGAARVARLSARLQDLARAGDFEGAPALADELALAVREAPAALREELSR